MTRRLAAATAVLALIVVGCSQAGQHELDIVREAVARTGQLPRRYTYLERTPDRSVTVKGVVADDFRYQSTISINDASAAEEIVVDDDVAMRVTSPGLLPSLGDRMRLGVWIIDIQGAPPLAISTEPDPGDDPALDARTALAYVQQAFTEGERVVRYNSESLDYDAREDTFPPPSDDVERYDVVRVPLAAAAAGAGGAPAPGVNAFRRMSVYVRDGSILQVLEDIDVASRLDDIARVYDADVPDNEDAATIAQAYIGAINALRTGQGNQPIRVRQMSLEFSDVGGAFDVSLPKSNGRGSAAPIRQALLAAAPRGSVSRPLALGSDLDVGQGVFGRATPRPARVPARASGGVVAIWLVLIPLFAAGALWLAFRRRTFARTLAS